MGEIKKGEKTSGIEKVHSVTTQNSPRLPSEASLSLQWEGGMLGETLIHSSYLAFGSEGQQVNHLTPSKNTLSGVWPLDLGVLPNSKHRSSDCEPLSFLELIPFVLSMFIYIQIHTISQIIWYCRTVCYMGH